MMMTVIPFVVGARGMVVMSFENGLELRQRELEIKVKTLDHPN